MLPRPTADPSRAPANDTAVLPVERDGRQEASARRWRAAVATLALGTLVLIALFWETAVSFFDAWSNSSLYGHGFLIVPIAAYLIWTRRVALVSRVPSGSAWGLALMAVAALGWLAGHLVGVLVVQQFALVMAIQALWLSVLGPRATRAIAFPLLFLLFAVPVGGFLIPPLQDLTARFVVSILRATGMPVYMDGLFIHIPSGSFHVAEACAGARYLLASLALGVLMAGEFFHTWWRRAAVVLLAAVISIFANGIRAYGIVMLAHLSDYKIAASVDHVVYGLVFLSFVFFCQIAAAIALRERHGPGEPGASDAAGIPAPLSARPSAAVMLGAAFGAVVIAAAGRGYGVYAMDWSRADAIVGTPPIEVAEPWVPVPNREEILWRPVAPGADHQSIQTFGKDGETLMVFSALFARQRQGAEVINELNDLVGGDQWSVAQNGRTSARLAGRPVELPNIRLVSRSGARVVWFWYWVDGRFTTSPIVAKVWELRAKLLGGQQAAALIAVSTDYDDSMARSEALLSSFLENIGPLDRTLEERVEPDPDTPSQVSAIGLRYARRAIQ